MRICADATPQAEWVADPAAHSGKELIALARTLPGARADRIGIFGISRGGLAALWAASTGAGVQAVVVDAPGHTVNINPRPPSTLDVLAGLTAPVLMMHGTADEVVPVEQAREYERAAHALGKPLVAVYFEGIGHQVSTTKESQAEARQRGIAFLREHLFR
jgi:dipeptidyl aminopeptidase/acylaminoacyl peptidase